MRKLIYIILLLYSTNSIAIDTDKIELDILFTQIMGDNLRKINPIEKPSKFNDINELLTDINSDNIPIIEEISPKSKVTSLDKKKNKPIIVIDAGHGGKDPGAIGYKKIKEKEVTLKYAKNLASKLKKSGKYEVYLTRNKDIFLALSMRNKIARIKEADMFISIHADAALNKKARGLSIYTLSDKASDKEAELLARKENRADIIAGINMHGLERDVSQTLIDLSLRDAQNNSLIFANNLQHSFNSRVIVRKKAVSSAGFFVLKNPNMISILLELGFITNKKDARNLINNNYMNSIIDGLIRSIDQYFR